MALALLLAHTTVFATEHLQLSFESEPEVLAVYDDKSSLLRFDAPHQIDLIALPAAVVTLKQGQDPPLELREQGVALGNSERTWLIRSLPQKTGFELARQWVNHPAVLMVMPDLLLSHQRFTFDDPEYASQWYHEFLGMDELFAQSTGDSAIRVAIIDSAIEVDHPDLAEGFFEPYDAFDDDDDPSPNPGEFCGSSSTAICDDHGTAVAGIIGARHNNGEGIVGFCPECTLIPIKLLGDGWGAMSRDIAAFEHAIDNDAAVINNSWGYTESIAVPDSVAEVIHRAATEPRDGLGALVVFAAGNDDHEIKNFELQALDDVLCVSATDRYGNPTAYTNEGESVDVAAPSATFTTTSGGGYMENFGGTSAAAPVVSGLAGWALSMDPSLSGNELYGLLVETSVPSPKVTHDDDGHHPIYGFGEVSPADLLSALLPEEEDEPPEEIPRGCACSYVAFRVPHLTSLSTLLLLFWFQRRQDGG
ncbi:MAG: S8 family serine peptidase [Proteobacteria bacterium]|nr:S8 family serine peptidase [Pseudomonadota bacterium]